MTAVLQWAALVMCLGCTLWRLPALFRGRNRGVFWAFFLISMCVALSIPAIYLPVDVLLGGVNFANVVLRLGLFTAVFLLAAKIAAAYNAPKARAFIRGPLGLAVLIACSAGILITYLLSDLSGSSPGLAGFGDQPSVIAYTVIGRLYAGFAAACLIAPTGQAAFSRLPALDRAAALSMCLGFAGICLALVAQATPWRLSSIMGLLSFGSILFVATGLALVWVSYLRGPQKQ
ncbi:hypothetical protein CVV68_22320 [Arthrobacter livingstonensis]|uniref:Uncharacterized protein n=1 Tax=Arthrobacter livingstonensis TaxID=670078 RepID=A0A2V5L047_9MICC|nr:hypothetical protein [Arthrobacter livingstonensis]PYI64308.1 hypothetical protein CVV68_22320 [Arthrobacter livingstonensis]